MTSGERIASLILLAGSVIMIIVGGVMFISKDRTEPKISFVPNDVTYYDGIANEELLEGVTASDDRDGDVSDRIVVEKIVVNNDNGTAVVYYAASDNSGNVTKASRQYKADIISDETEEAEGESDGTADPQTAGIAAVTSGDNAGAEGTDEEAGEEGEGEEGEEGETTEGDADGEGSAEEEEESEEERAAAAAAASASASRSAEQQRQEEERKRSEAEERARAEAERSAQAEREAVERASSSTSKPRIILKKNNVTTRVGVSFAYVEVIESLNDDKDNYEALFRNLSTSRYDKNTPGTYNVSISTKDSDGNASDPVSLTVTVIR